MLFAQRLVTWPVTLRQSGSIWDRVIERADVFILREATRQSGVSISAALDGSGSTLFAPGRSALDFACAQKWHINSFARPLNVRILHFWRIALGGGISMSPARAQKLSRALAHSNRLQHTVHRQLVPGRHRAIRVGCGAAPRRLGGRLLRGRQRRAGAIPGTTAAAWLRWSLPNGRLRFLH